MSPKPQSKPVTFLWQYLSCFKSYNKKLRLENQTSKVHLPKVYVLIFLSFRDNKINN